jgi:hypothetical protein
VASDRGEELPDAEVTVGLERAYAKFVGQGERLAVVVLGLIALGGLAPRRHLAEEAKGILLVAPFLVPTGTCSPMDGETVCLLMTAGQQLRLTQGETTKRPMTCHCCWRALFHRLREQWHGISDAPGQGVRCTQGRSH